jgi:hypothetical protein
VEVQVETNRGVKPLNKRDCATLCFARRAELAGAADQRREDRLDENIQNIRHELRIVRQTVADSMRKR